MYSGLMLIKERSMSAIKAGVSISEDARAKKLEHMLDAGAEWVDDELQVGGSIVSSGRPNELSSFNRVMVEAFAGDGAKG